MQTIHQRLSAVFYGNHIAYLASQIRHFDFLLELAIDIRHAKEARKV